MKGCEDQSRPLNPEGKLTNLLGEVVHRWTVVGQYRSGIKIPGIRLIFHGETFGIRSPVGVVLLWTTGKDTGYRSPRL
jgi:hypothetical protein